MYFSELKLAEKIGKVLYIAVTENKYNRYELIHKWLASDTYDETVNFYVHLCSQAKTYILAAFEIEFENDLPSIDEESPLYGEDLYWFGYVMAYWFFIEQISGTDILKMYDVDRILDSYGALHAVSVKRAIEEIKENDVLATDPSDTE